MATITYTVTVASGTNRHGTGNKYYLNGTVSPNINLIEGNTYIFDQIGDSLSDPYLYLRNEGGFILTSDDDGGSGLNSQITFTAENTGSYYLDAGAYRNAIGTYSISGQRVPAANVGFSSSDGWGEISASRAFEKLLKTFSIRKLHFSGGPKVRKVRQKRAKQDRKERGKMEERKARREREK